MIGELERVCQQFIDEVKQDEQNAVTASKIMITKVNSLVDPVGANTLVYQTLVNATDTDAAKV